MLILHTRLDMTEKSTTGKISIEGKHYAYTLEDPQRKEKIWGQTAIPAGMYRVCTTWSTKLKREVLMLSDVPGFDRVYVHSGNKAEDTEGCVLIARNLSNPDYIQGDSKILVDQLFKRVKAYIAQGIPVWWKIEGLPKFI